MNLRISMNINPVDGPNGGGFHFARALEQCAIASGYTVFRTLVPDLDAILIVSARHNPITTAYPLAAIAEYRRRYPNAVVLARVNACDEQKGEVAGVSRAWLLAADMSDAVVFVSEFMQQLYIRNGMPANHPQTVIHSGADEMLFQPHSGAVWHACQRMRIVTHHWSTAATKGFDIYERLDALMGTSPYRELFEFAYIGRLPLGLTLKNTRVVPQLSAQLLAQELQRHHVHVTATRFEPAGYHFIESMRCGLPVLYLDDGTLRSGSLPEYCAPYGVAFNLVNFEEKLVEMRERYTELRRKVQDCPYTASRMASQYLAYIEEQVALRRANPRPALGVLQNICFWGQRQRRTVGLLRRRMFRYLADM